MKLYILIVILNGNITFQEYFSDIACGRAVTYIKESGVKGIEFIQCTQKYMN